VKGIKMHRGKDYIVKKVIWKQVLSYNTLQEICVPKGAEFLCTMIQKNDICIWFSCDPSQENETCRIRIIGTGYEFNDEGEQYLGSVMHESGDISLVFHIYLVARELQ